MLIAGTTRYAVNSTTVVCCNRLPNDLSVNIDITMNDSNSPEVFDDEYWMQQALELAEQAAACGEVPVGAILVAENQCIGKGYNQPLSANDPTAHAEIVALRDAAKNIGNYRLPGTTLYVTIEPCTMCFGAMIHSRIERLVYGASEPKAGIVQSQLKLSEQDFYNHQIQCEGSVLADKCSAQISEFFHRRRQARKR